MAVPRTRMRGEHEDVIKKLFRIQRERNEREKLNGNGKDGHKADATDSDAKPAEAKPLELVQEHNEVAAPRKNVIVYNAHVELDIAAVSDLKRNIEQMEKSDAPQEDIIKQMFRVYEMEKGIANALSKSFEGNEAIAWTEAADHTLRSIRQRLSQLKALRSMTPKPRKNGSKP